MLEIQHLAKSYPGPSGQLAVLADLCLQVQPGEFVAVQGPSGCGKSTLLLIAGGLLQPDAGRVVVGGQDVYALSPEERARFRADAIGFVFQQFHLVPYLSVLDNVLAPTLAATIPGARDRAKELIERFGLAPRCRHVPAQLSTGERQRTALARALLNRPRLLLADEPTGNLDDENGQLVLRFIADYAKGGGAVLLVTHDRRAAAVADRTIPFHSNGHAAPAEGGPS
jgi:putative ABC transport system ATP-binding protein